MNLGVSGTKKKQPSTTIDNYLQLAGRWVMSLPKFMIVICIFGMDLLHKIRCWSNTFHISCWSLLLHGRRGTQNLTTSRQCRTTGLADTWALLNTSWAPPWQQIISHQNLSSVKVQMKKYVISLLNHNSDSIIHIIIYSMKCYSNKNKARTPNPGHKLGKPNNTMQQRNITH